MVSRWSHGGPHLWLCLHLDVELLATALWMRPSTHSCFHCLYFSLSLGVTSRALLCRAVSNKYLENDKKGTCLQWYSITCCLSKFLFFGKLMMIIWIPALFLAVTWVSFASSRVQILPAVCFTAVILSKASEAVAYCVYLFIYYLLLKFRTPNESGSLTKPSHFIHYRCYTWRFKYWSSGKVLHWWLLRPVWSDSEQWVARQPTRSCSSQLVTCQNR